MKPLDFKDRSAKRIYHNYIRRCDKMLNILSAKDKEESLLEINSYIYEYLQDHSSNDELESLLNIIERIGAPEETLKEVIATKKLKQAAQTFQLKHLLQALLLNLSNGVIYVILSILTLLLVAFPIMITLKLIYPADTGYFVGGGQHDFGFIRGDKGEEVMGSWFIPLMIAGCLLLYVFIILLIKVIEKNKVNSVKL